MQLFFASSNKHKIRELQELYSSTTINLELLTLLDHPEWQTEIDETGNSYQENALLKAQAYQKISHLPTLADDSGLEIDALPGLLGIKSARWVAGSDHDRALALLDRLRNEKNRAGHYTCVLCFLPMGEAPIFFTGICAGTIALKASHTKGFGYDPIFIPDGYEQTFTTLGEELKNKLSHRHQAFEELIQYLQKL